MQTQVELFKEPKLSRHQAQNKVIRIFFESHLGNGHDGLAKLAKTKKIDVKNLSPGEFCIFINKRYSFKKP